MEIEVGDYIRTKEDGLIRKVKEIEKYKYTYDTYYICEKTDIYYMEEDIKKHSKNIIDLIEDGDIINGFTVEEFDDDEGEYLGIPIYNDGAMDTIQEVRPIDTIKIKTILTYEQHNQNCFKMEE